jgi:hypothetical protein
MTIIERIFLKVPSRIEILKSNYPNILLSPEPIIIRGDMLIIRKYYFKNDDEIKNIASMLDSKHTTLISKEK